MYVVAAVKTTAAPSGMLTPVRRAWPVLSMATVPRSVVPTLNVTIPTGMATPETVTVASRSPCQPVAPPVSGTQVPLVEPAAHRVLVGCGETKVTTGGVPTVTAHGETSAPALPARSVPVAATWLVPSGSTTFANVA